VSRQNVEIVRQAIEAANRRAWDEALRNIHQSAEWHPLETDPDQRRYSGPAGVREFWQSWIDIFENFRLETMELIDAGDQAILVARVSGQGKHSGAQASSPLFGAVVQFAEGKILRVKMYPSRDDALQAAGLSEQRTRSD
jgi:ketosteroid isomerase-like protein